MVFRDKGYRMICPTCGHKNRDNARSCGVCTVKLIFDGGPSEKEIQESVDDAEYQDKPWLIPEQESNHKKTTFRFNSTGNIIMIIVLFTVVSSIINLCGGAGD